MPPAPLPPDLRAAAPGLAGRFVLIMASLVALVARRYLRMPHRVALIVPLCTYLARAGRRFERLAARLAAGKLRLRRPHSGPSPARLPRVRLPAADAWLIRDLGYEAAAFRCHLEALLAEPAMAALLAAAPSSGRILRPLCRMLGLPAAGLPQAPGRPAAPVLAAPVPLAPRQPHPSPPARPPEPPCPRARWPWVPRLAAKPA